MKIAFATFRKNRYPNVLRCRVTLSKPGKQNGRFPEATKGDRARIVITKCQTLRWRTVREAVK